MWLLFFLLLFLYSLAFVHVAIEHLLMHCQMDNDATNESWCKVNQQTEKTVDFLLAFE